MVTARPTGPRRGFTIIELMITLGVAGLLTALAVTTLRDTLAMKREGGAARAVAGMVKRARAHAIATHSLVRVEAFTATNTVELSACRSQYGIVACAAGESFAALTSGTLTVNRAEYRGVRLTAGTASVTFNASGFPDTTASYTLDDAGRPGSFTVTVSVAGEVSVQ